MDWTLTPLQVENWAAHWDRHYPNRNQAALAETLSKIPVKVRSGEQKKSADSWKPDLSNFFKGDAKALKKILGDEHVSEAVARHLKLKNAGELRAIHASIRGQLSDGLFDVRIPGFEDYGPVPAVDLYLPPAGGGRDGITMGEESINHHPPHLSELVRACMPGETSHSITIEGGPGSGRTTLLRALAASLSENEIPWANTPEEQAVVLLIDDWDASAELQRAVQAWIRPGRTVVIARAIDPAQVELGTAQAVITLSPPTPYWMHGYIDRVRAVLQARWNLPFDTEKLHHWLDEDALASEFIRNFRSIGLVMRAASKGIWPISPDKRPQFLMDQLTQLIGSGPERTFLEDFGAELLQRLAYRMVASRICAIPRRELTTIAAEIATPLKAKVALDDAGVFRPVDALLHVGPFRMHKGLVSCDALAFLLPAMVDNWGSDIEGVFTVSEAGHVAEAAALRFGDTVLQAAMNLDPSDLISALPTITRILRCNAPYRDHTLYLKAFRMCAVWWAHAPKNPGIPGPSPLPAEDRFDNNTSPLLLLAQASVRHRKLLPCPLDALSLSGDLPSVLRRWLAIHKITTPDNTVFEAVLSFVSPAQSRLFPSVAEVRTNQDWHQTHIPRLAPPEWELWWRTVLVPLWSNLSDGKAFIAGVAEGSTPIIGACQSVDAGLRLWTEALETQITAGDPRTLKAIHTVLAFAFSRGGALLHHALVNCARTWSRLRSHLQNDLLEAMKPLRPMDWWDTHTIFSKGESLLRIVLQKVFSTIQVEELWTAWATTEIDDLPWRPFVTVGITPTQVVTWALNRGEEGLKDPVDFWPGLPMVSTRHQKSLRLTAIEELTTGSDEAAVVAFAAPIPHALRQRLRSRIHALDPHTLRKQRIKATIAYNNWYSPPLIENLLPAADDEALWMEIIHSSPSIAQRLGHLVQWCAGQEGPERWRLFLEALSVLEVKWSQQPCSTDGQPLHDMNRFWLNGGEFISRQLARKDLSGPEDRQEVVRRLLGHPTWAPAFTGWNSGIWPLAMEILPEEEFRALLLADLRSPWGQDARPARLGALMYGGQLDLVIQLLKDPVLGSAASEVLGGLRFHDAGWPLTKLKEICIDRPFKIDGVVNRLAVIAIRHQPKQTMDWVIEQLHNVAPDEALLWWESLLPQMSASLERSEGLRQYFSLLEASPIADMCSGRPEGSNGSA
jgi:hypothetical protein